MMQPIKLVVRIYHPIRVFSKNELLRSLILLIPTITAHAHANIADVSALEKGKPAAVESLRINVKSRQLRASFFASVRSYHEFYIELLMSLHRQHPSEGFDAAALQASEKGRARSLLELLAEARAEIRRDIDPTLTEREQNLRLMISDITGPHSRSRANGDDITRK